MENTSRVWSLAFRVSGTKEKAETTTIGSIPSSRLYNNQRVSAEVHVSKLLIIADVGSRSAFISVHKLIVGQRRPSLPLG